MEGIEGSLQSISDNSFGLTGGLESIAVQLSNIEISLRKD